MQDNLTIDRINKAHPKIKEELLSLYLQCNNMLPKNVRLRFSYVFRSPEEQHALFLKRPKVTNADSWQSIHNYGLAFDIVLLYDKNNDGTFESASWDNDKNWQIVVAFFKSKGYEWGGDWKKFKDAPHFQKDFGLSWQKMKTKIDNDDFTSEIINGYTYKYINI
jgi:peptidoglycan L-alanyl-D-glutamate endopeptidase CwlK